jgi:K+-transporting ATPase ATPase C chain
MRRDLLSAALAIVVLTVLLGVVYPLVVTGLAQTAFPGRANGSQLQRDGRTVGSRLIAQDFRGEKRYFQSRPSAQTSYSASATAFTNLGPNSAKARDAFAANLKGYLARERPYDAGLVAGGVPVDAVTSSASGVDPHISPANAAIQARRIAAVRHLALGVVAKLIEKDTDGRFLGLLGEPGVNVLALNLALDRAAAAR